jgi:hypothetical protein
MKAAQAVRRTSYQSFEAGSVTFPKAYRPQAAKPVSRSRSIIRRKSLMFDSPIAVMLSVSAIAYVFVIAFTTIQFTFFGSNIRSFVPQEEQAAPISRGVASKEDFLKHVSVQKKNEVGGEISYVARIVAGHGVRLNEAHQLAQLIVKESRSANVDPFFVAAVMKMESTFKHRAVSNKGATGLMQVMPGTAQFVAARFGRSVGRLTDPTNNIRLGISYLKYLKGEFRGNAEHTLVAYNWGPANLAKALKHRSRIPTSTLQYARKIMRDHQRWHADYSAKAKQFEYMAANTNLIG